MNKYWLVATYKANETNKLETNLSNQNYKYYLPKIITIKNSSSLKEVVLFPGYVFINTYLDNFSALKFTGGIKKIIKFGDNIPFISNNEIRNMKMVEKESKKNPISSKVKIGQEAIISQGSFKGTIVKICSLPSNKRVDIFLSLLGSKRKISIPEENLIL